MSRGTIKNNVMKVRKRDFSQIKDDQILSNTEEGQNKIKTFKNSLDLKIRWLLVNLTSVRTT